VSYLSSRKQHSFSVGMVTYQVDHVNQQLLNEYTRELYRTRRLAMAPLMPMKVRGAGHMVYGGVVSWRE